MTSAPALVATPPEDYARAILNILEDATNEKVQASDVHRSMVNILEDLFAEKAWLEAAQKGILNILEDFDIEKIKVERAYRDLGREASERLEAEEAMQAANEAAEAANRELAHSNAELESFSYTVAHDLRAPLRAIDGFSRILLEDHADRLNDEANRVLGVIIENVGRMGGLIDDLLAFSRLGRTPLAKRQLDMTELVRSVTGELVRAEPDRVISCTVEALAGAYCDSTTIRQVWINLLTNALKFTRKRSPAVISVRSEVTSDEVVYSIRDNGVGFDMRYADKLFGVFQRLHPVGEFEGTGIGLAMVARVVQKHGGRVWADGVVGGGATFSFALPREPGNEEEGP